MYFQNLNYTLSNEDTRIERDIFGKSPSIFSIAGSGARVLGLLHSDLDRVVINDISREQLALTELRLVAAKTFAYEDFLGFLGYTQCSNRTHLVNQLQLTSTTKGYFESFSDQWQKDGLIYMGKWEQFLLRLHKIFTAFSFDQFHIFFEESDMHKRKELLDHVWPQKRFQLFLNLFCNEFIFDKFLYKGSLNLPGFERDESLPHFLHQTFLRLFSEQNPRESYFLQMLFLGRVVYPEGYPLEANKDLFPEFKKCQASYEYIQGDLLQVLNENRNLAAYSLSDVISYLKPDSLDVILKLLDGPEARHLVARSFLKHPHQVQGQNWQQDYLGQALARQKDTVGVYRFWVFGHKHSFS